MHIATLLGAVLLVVTLSFVDATSTYTQSFSIVPNGTFAGSVGWINEQEEQLAQIDEAQYSEAQVYSNAIGSKDELLFSILDPNTLCPELNCGSDQVCTPDLAHCAYSPDKHVFYMRPYQTSSRYGTNIQWPWDVSNIAVWKETLSSDASFVAFDELIDMTTTYEGNTRRGIKLWATKINEALKTTPVYSTDFAADVGEAPDATSPLFYKHWFPFLSDELSSKIKTCIVVSGQMHGDGALIGYGTCVTSEHKIFRLPSVLVDDPNHICSSVGNAMNLNLQYWCNAVMYRQVISDVHPHPFSDPQVTACEHPWVGDNCEVYGPQSH